MSSIKGFLSRHFKKAAIGALAPLLLLSTSTLHDSPPPPAPAMTAHSLSMGVHNQKFSAASPFDYTFFLDRDQIQARAAAANPALKYEDAMIAGLRSYLLDQSGIALNKDTLKNIVGSLGVSAGQANNRPFRGIEERTGREVTGRACFINPQDPDMTSRSIRNLVMGFNGSHGELAAQPIRRDMSLEILRRFNEYHELGHCMNEEYLQALFKIEPTPANAPRIARLKHTSEARAEVFAALMLARDGVNNVAGIRADHRLAGVALTGYQIAKYKGWETADSYSGYKYAVHEALWNTQRVIDRVGISEIKKMSPQELALLAKNIVDHDPLNTPEAGRAVTALLKSRFDLDKMKADYPGLHGQFNVAARVRQQVADAFTRLYGPDVIDPNRSVFDQLPLDGRAPGAPKSAEPTPVPVMTAQLLNSAGNALATQKTLDDVVVRLRDQLRAVLRNGSQAEQDQAASRLQAIPQAHREAASIIQKKATPAASPAIS
ncbi:MAG: hypothetical protein ACXW4B_00085 [Micavibrio sp.]